MATYTARSTERAAAGIDEVVLPIGPAAMTIFCQRLKTGISLAFVRNVYDLYVTTQGLPAARSHLAGLAAYHPPSLPH